MYAHRVLAKIPLEYGNDKLSRLLDLEYAALRLAMVNHGGVGRVSV